MLALSHCSRGFEFVQLWVANHLFTLGGQATHLLIFYLATWLIGSFSILLFNEISFSFLLHAVSSFSYGISEIFLDKLLD